MLDVPGKFYELCRLCLATDGVKLSIFEEEGLQRKFAEKIHACLSIAVSSIALLSVSLCVCVYLDSQSLTLLFSTRSSPLGIYR